MAACAQASALAFDAAARRGALDAAVAGKTGALARAPDSGRSGPLRTRPPPRRCPPIPPHWTLRDLAGRVLDSSDELLRHKTSWRDLYDGETGAPDRDLDEVIFPQ